MYSDISIRIEVLLVVKQRLGQRLGQLGLADARRAEEQERAERAVRVLDAGAAALDGLRDGRGRPHPAPRRAYAACSSRCSSFSRSPSIEAVRPGCPSSARRSSRSPPPSPCPAAGSTLLGVLRRRPLPRASSCFLSLGQLAVLQTGRPSRRSPLCSAGFDLAAPSCSICSRSCCTRADGVLLVFPLGLHRVERLALLGQLLLAAPASRALRELVGPRSSARPPRSPSG